MDISSVETETQQSFHSPPRRRRSTFFVRRESLAPQPQNNHDDDDDESEIRRLHQELLRYSSELTIEKDQWKKEVRDRRNQYHDLRQQYELAKKAPSRSRITSSYASLTTEDIEFLKGKPNIAKFIKMQEDLDESVKLSMAFVRSMNDRYTVTLSHSENLLQKITDYILENSTIELKES